MTNKEREQRYQDWNDLLYQYLQGDGDEERLCALGELLETIGNLVAVDVSELTEKINLIMPKYVDPLLSLLKRLRLVRCIGLLKMKRVCIHTFMAVILCGR